MEHQPQTEPEAEELEQPDTFASEYRASLQSRDYGDLRIFPNIDALVRIGDYWADELKNPDRSERSKNEIEKILTRVAFEIHSRQYPTKIEVETLEQVYALELPGAEQFAYPEQQAA